MEKRFSTSWFGKMSYECFEITVNEQRKDRLLCQKPQFLNILFENYGTSPVIQRSITQVILIREDFPVWEYIIRLVGFEITFFHVLPDSIKDLYLIRFTWYIIITLHINEGI